MQTGTNMSNIEETHLNCYDSTEELQSIVSSIDLNNIALFIQRAVEAKTHLQQQKMQPEQHRGSQESQQISERFVVENQEETPKFGFIHGHEQNNEAQGNQHTLRKESQEVLEIQEKAQRQQQNTLPNFLKFDLPKRTLDSIPSKYCLYNKKSIKLDLEIQKIQNLPLYGIDHAKEFFQNHPILSERLKIEQSLTRFFCNNNGIEPEAFSGGLEIKEDLRLSGPELKEIMSIIFLTTFRKIQQFITSVCRKKIVKIENKDLAPLFPIFLNAKNSLEEPHLMTLIRMMRQAFDLPSKPTQKEVFNFYAFLMDILNSSRQNEEIDFLYGDEQLQQNLIWGQQKQLRLCELFLRHKSVQSSLQNFNKEFNSTVSVCYLRLKLQKMVKIMLKHIECQILKNDKERQFCVYLNSNDYRTIMRDPKAYGVRTLLLRLYIQGEIYLEDLKTVIDEVQKFIHGRTKTEKRNGKLPQDVNSALKKKRKTKTSEEDDDSSSQSSQSLQSNEEVVSHPTLKKLKKLNEVGPSQGRKQLTLPDSFQRSEGKGQLASKKVKNHALSNVLRKGDLLLRSKGSGKLQMGKKSR